MGRAWTRPPKGKETPPFERVWRLVRRIPRGKVATYGQLSQWIERLLTPVGVGWAVRAAPDDLIPWQRVVNAHGGISTDAEHPGLQRAMLEAEGVRFSSDGHIDLTRYGWDARGCEAREIHSSRRLMTTKGHSFKAVLGGKTGDRPVVEVPFDVRAAFGAARAKVKVTVNGVVLRTTVAVYGGRSYVGFREEIRRAAGISIGDEIRVKVEADREVREVVVPASLARALRGNAAARKRFDALSFTHRKEYARWVGDAKKPETAARRVEKTLQMLEEGTKHP
jgi:methylated-DNA-protein-cysteine methyltransferase-like protein